MANSGAVIADLYPREQRGRAYGFTSLGWTIGAVLGVVLGGLIVTYVSWRWIFWINVPTGRARHRGRAAGAARQGRADQPAARPARHGHARPRPVRRALGDHQARRTGPFDASTAGFLIGGVALIARVRVHRVAGPRADAAAADLQGPDDGGLAVRVPLPGAGQLRGALPAADVPAGAARAVADPRVAAAAARLPASPPASASTRAVWRTSTVRCCPRRPASRLQVVVPDAVRAAQQRDAAVVDRHASARSTRSARPCSSRRTARRS